MRNSKKKVENRIVALILSFILSVFLLITSATFIVNGFILSRDAVIGSLREANFHEGAYDELRDTLEDRLIPTGLPNTILDGAITPDGMYADLNDYVTSMFANELPNLERVSIEEILNDNIDYHLLEIGLSREEIEYGVINEIVNEVIDNYNDYVSSPFISYMARVSNLFQGHLRILIITGLVGTLITALIAFFVSRRSSHLAFRIFGFSFGTAALMLIVAPLALRIWGGYHRLGIGQEFDYNFVVAHIERTIFVFLLAGAIFIVLYLIFIIISARLHRTHRKA